ncbi:leucine-rich repeat protein [Sodaliphilus sp.]|uniref:leucine-rich repeat protein n=1 Tax=Sodaliphilus sp. TaxID=2815818 RepID=UPI00388E916E
MKKLFFSIIMALVAVQAWAVASVGTMFTDGDLAYRVLNTGSDDTYPSVRVIGFSATGEKKTSVQLTIPAYATFNGETYAVKNVDPSAFKGKTSITGVRFMYGVHTIDASAFENCTNITYADIPSSMLFIYGKAFAGCTKLAKVYYALPDPTGRVINSDAFPSNSGMTLYVPRTNANSVELYKKIPVFSKFSTVTKSALACDFSIGTGERLCVTKAPTKSQKGQVTIVGLYANASDFTNTNGVLKRSSAYSIAPYKYDLVSICDSAFVNNTSLKGVDFTGCSTLTAIGAGAFNGCTALTSVTLNTGLTNIKNLAFAGCTALVSITLPSTVSFVNMSFVDASTAMTTISVEAGNKYYMSHNGILYDKSGKLIRCPEGKVGFLSNGYFPTTITTVERYAFDRCSGLTRIELPYGVKSIGEYAFRYCSGMSNCQIPSSVKTLSANAFKGCTNLSSLSCNLVTPPTMSSTSFVDCKKAILFVPYEAISAYQKADYWKDWGTVQSGAYDFYNTYSGYYTGYFTVMSTEKQTISSPKEYDGRARLVVQTMPDNGGTINIPEIAKFNNKNYAVTSVGGKVIGSTPSTNYKVNMGVMVDTICASAFDGQSHLVELNLNPNLKRVEAYAFRNCRISNDIAFSYGLDYLGSNAFYGNPIKKMRIPSSLQTINKSFAVGLTSLQVLYFNNIFTGTGYDFTSIPKSCKLYVPYNGVATYKAHSEWGKAFSSIEAGAYDFATKENAPEHMTVISKGRFTVGNDVYDGKAKIVYHPAHKEQGINEIYGSPYFEDNTNGSGWRYAITEIGDSCFAGCENLLNAYMQNFTNLEKIGKYAFYQSGINGLELPASVKTIGNYAFNSCKNLYQITCNATTPPTIQATTINTSYDKTLKVPDESVDAYKAANYWKNFYRIIGINGTPSGQKGDVDGNGTVDINDANILFNILLGKDTASKYNGRADVDGNGTVDITDANLIINILLGK